MNMQVPLKSASVLMSALLAWTGFNGVSTAETTLEDTEPATYATVNSEKRKQQKRQKRSPMGGRLKSQIMIQVYH